MKSENINELAAALSKAQSEFKPAKKSGTNKFYKKPDGTFHTYSTLKDVIEATTKPLSSNGLSVSQLFKGEILETILMHQSGQWVSGECVLINQKGDMQGLASAATYARRYSLSAITGLPDEEDDDANTADNKTENKTTQPKTYYVPPLPDYKEQIGNRPTANAKAFDEYVCPLKKFQGKKLSQIQDFEIQNYVDWIKREGITKPDFLEFIKQAETYLKNLYAKHPSEPKDNDPGQEFAESFRDDFYK